MSKSFLTSILILLICADLLSQKRTEDFEITLPEQKVQNSLYNKLTFFDSRYDTSNMGIVQLGAFNKKAKVVPEIPFSVQLQNVMHSLTDATAKDGELFFLLRHFNFAEITGAMSERGYCHLKADMFSYTGEYYKKIASIDTVVLIKAMDVTRAMFRNGSKTITNFIASNLLREAEDSAGYSLRDVMNLDAFEKRKIPVYNTVAYTDGLYTNYKSFMNQVPDKKISVEMKGQKISSVKAADESGDMKKVKGEDIYAIVHNGQPYIATDYGFYPLQKTSDDFFFTGKAKVTANTGEVLVAGFFFGVIGTLIASNAKATFEMKIDHSSGGFIRLREVNEGGE